jgi:integrase
VERYFAQHVGANLRPGTAAGKRAAFDNDILPAWGHRPLDEIKPADVVALVDSVVARAPIGANRLLAMTRAFFNWGVGKMLLAESPCAKVKRPTKEKTRDRTLSEDEIAWFWRGCTEVGPPFGDLFRLLLVTAQRRDEAREMPWREVDLDKRTWTISAARTKTGTEHEVALSNLAVEILSAIGQRSPEHQAADLVFASERPRPRNRGKTAISGLSRAKRRLDAAMARLAAPAEIEPFTLHDLRRTAATEMAALRIPAEVVEKVLNHSSGVIRPIAKIYNRHKYGPQQREALVAWGRRLATLVGEAVEPVVELRARA